MDEISEREPLPLFERWYGEALAAESDANAMVLATVGADGRPSARGQVRFEGAVEAVTAAEADAYFATRPRDSRIGAWASDQSRPLASRAALEDRVAAFTRRFGDSEIPRPPFWSGYRVVPHRVEFWQERPFRLHDRWLYVRVNGAWQCERLFP